MAVVNRSLHSGGSVSYEREAGTSGCGATAPFTSTPYSFGEHTVASVQLPQDSDSYMCSHKGNESDKKRKSAQARQNRIKKKQEEAALREELSQIQDEAKGLEKEKRRAKLSIQQLEESQPHWE